MKCEEFLRLLDAGAPVTTDAAAAHLAQCADCRRRLEHVEAAQRELAAMRDEAPPPFLHARVMAHVRAERRAPRRWWNVALRPVWAGAALVVLLLVAVSGVRIYEWLRPAGRVGPSEKTPTRVSSYQAPQPSPALEVQRSAPAPAAGAVGGPVATTAGNGGVPPLPKAKAIAPARREFAPAPPEQRIAAAQPAASPAGIEAPAQGGPPLGLATDRMEEGRGATGSLAAGARLASPALPAVSAPPARLGATAASSGASYGVVCELRPAGGGEAVRGLLPPAATPPPKVEWHVVVAADGNVAVTDAAGDAIAAAAQPVAGFVGAHHLPAGSYLLRRVTF
jgi:hypothetical protein